MKKIISPPAGKFQHIFSTLQEQYRDQKDPFGLNLDACRRNLELFWPIYKHYFRVRCFNPENVDKNKSYIITSNHSGQIPFDGMLISMCFALEISPPRIVRTLYERFVTKLPFFGEYINQLGPVLGNRQNCSYLLDRGETILVFPEGVKGISKNTKDYYKLKPFTKGHFRMALKAGVDILPVAVIGAEEIYPWVYHPKKLAKWLGLPALPLTPFFPFFGPIGALPFPSPIDIYIGRPYPIPTNLSPDAPDYLINFHVVQIKNQIQQMIKLGKEQRRPICSLPGAQWFNEIVNNMVLTDN